MSAVLNIALDTETSGFGTKNNRVIEIAAVAFDPQTGEPTGDTYYTQLNPQKPISAEATAVHGKTWDMLKDEPKFGDVAADFAKFIEGAHLVAHNAKFDVDFLNMELALAGRPALADLGCTVTDTLEVARACVHEGRHTLDALCGFFKVDNSARTLHGALVDCELLAAVYPSLMAHFEAFREDVRGLLGFDIFSPDYTGHSFGQAAREYIKLHRVASALAKRKKQLQAHIESLTGRQPHSESGFELNFKPSSRMDWDKVKAALLSGIDLSVYKKDSAPSFSLKLAGDEDEES